MQTIVKEPDDLSIGFEGGWTERQIGLCNDKRNRRKLRFIKSSKGVIGIVEHHENADRLERKKC